MLFSTSHALMLARSHVLSLSLSLPSLMVCSWSLCTCVFTCAFGDQMTPFGVIPQDANPFYLKKCLSIACNLPSRLGWLANALPSPTNC